MSAAKLPWACYGPGSMLGALWQSRCHCFIQSSWQPSETGLISHITEEQRETPEVRQLARGQTACQWQNWDYKLGFSDSRSSMLDHTAHPVGEETWPTHRLTGRGLDAAGLWEGGFPSLQRRCPLPPSCTSGNDGAPRWDRDGTHLLPGVLVGASTSAFSLRVTTTITTFYFLKMHTLTFRPVLGNTEELLLIIVNFVRCDYGIMDK